MSYRRLLIYRCDIYHLQTTEEQMSYGVPVKKRHVYSDTADISDVPCYVSKSIRAPLFISQQEPNAVITDAVSFHFLKGTDVRINDRIIYDGEAYKIKVPKLIRNHHIEAEAERVESL